MNRIVWALILTLVAACGSTTGEPVDVVTEMDDDTREPTSETREPNATSTSTSSALDSATTTGPITSTEPPVLLGAPLVFAATGEGFELSVALASGAPDSLLARVRRSGSAEFVELVEPVVPAQDVVRWRASGLEPGTAYEFEILSVSSSAPLYQGNVTTARAPGQSFGFALVSDTHIGSDLAYSNQGDPATLLAVASELAATQPDFVVNLGDILDFHQFGFNVPPPSSSVTRSAYLNYRTQFGDSLGHLAHFGVLGGWDGENGCDSEEEVTRSRVERLLYLPGPRPNTYPQGGSTNEDYYAFEWGDALFIMLNIYSYTPTCHLLGTYPGAPDDWTLGAAQLGWLEKTLQEATARWRFILIHHPAGGAGGDSINAAYGRGGGLAAEVGEQATIHQLMIDHGVQVLFYGHDHVFTDMVVDDIHYSLPGSAGAPWHFTESETGYTEFWPDSGWAKVDVSPTELHVQFIAQGGEMLHEYTLD